MAARHATDGRIVRQRQVLSVRRALIRRARRWLFFTHRWIGIVTCLFCAMWFVSGIVMMYVAFPRFTDTERWAALPRITWDKVQVPPDRAMAIARVTAYPRELRLAMLADMPVYRVMGWNGERMTISAVDGATIEHISPEQALAVAAFYPGAGQPRIIDLVERDQWSVTARFDPLRPCYLIDLGDDAGTQIYVSTRSGEIALDTTRTERIWNWVGSIPH